MNKTLITLIKNASFELENVLAFKSQMRAWAASYEVACYLDSNGYARTIAPNVECLLAVGAKTQLTYSQDSSTTQDPFVQLRNFYEQDRQWLFGFLTYDLKNSIENLSSNNFDGLGLPEMHFFKPKYVLELTKNTVKIHSTAESPEALFRRIKAMPIVDERPAFQQTPELKARIEPKEYLNTIARIHEHLHRGDLYEMNFCQEFYAEQCEVNPLALFERLNQLSKAPFSAYYRLDDQYLLCASPERFLQKKDQQLIAQPIKGTIKRGANKAKDEALKKALFNNQKDRSENVMIVDLVRNDLAKSCLAGSVKVDELFGIYSFEQVHQMISTISGTLRPDLHFTDAIRNAFPMGSMTGAPKVSSMHLIERYEKSKRGLYSGAIGYISPTGDFDFNVVIRSMIYDARQKYLSFQVGGAIVYDSVAEKEYEECLLKAKGILEALEVKIQSVDRMA